MLGPPDGPSLTPSTGDEVANVGSPDAATFGPTGMNTPLYVRRIKKSGFVRCTSAKACSCDATSVPDAGMRSYVTSQPRFSRSLTASFAPSSKLGVAVGDSPRVWYAPTTCNVFLDWPAPTD